MSNSSFTVRFIAALTARNSEQPSRDTETAIANAERSKVALDAVMSRPHFKEVAGKLIKSARIAQAQQDRDAFIAVKVLVKIVALLSGVGQGRAAELDPYSRVLIANCMHANGLSNKASLVSLSKSISFDTTDTVFPLKRSYNCTPGTASTQMSSTRMMLNYLSIAEVSKGKRGDVFTMLDNERARDVMQLFSEKVIAEVVQPDSVQPSGEVTQP